MGGITPIGSSEGEKRVRRIVTTPSSITLTGISTLVLEHLECARKNIIRAELETITWIRYVHTNPRVGDRRETGAGTHGRRRTGRVSRIVSRTGVLVRIRTGRRNNRGGLGLSTVTTIWATGTIIRNPFHWRRQPRKKQENYRYTDPPPHTSTAARIIYKCFAGVPETTRNHKLLKRPRVGGPRRCVLEESRAVADESIVWGGGATIGSAIDRNSCRV